MILFKNVRTLRLVLLKEYHRRHGLLLLGLAFHEFDCFTLNPDVIRGNRLVASLDYLAISAQNSRLLERLQLSVKIQVVPLCQ